VLQTASLVLDFSDEGQRLLLSRCPRSGKGLRPGLAMKDMADMLFEEEATVRVALAAVETEA
jgi:hypothetical protein